jgi:hypothetical protein
VAVTSASEGAKRGGQPTASLGTLARVCLADKILQAVGIAHLTISNRVELPLEVVLWAGFASWTVLVDPEQC